MVARVYQSLDDLDSQNRCVRFAHRVSVMSNVTVLLSEAR